MQDQHGMVLYELLLDRAKFEEEKFLMKSFISLL